MSRRTVGVLALLGTELQSKGTNRMGMHGLLSTRTGGKPVDNLGKDGLLGASNSLGSSPAPSHAGAAPPHQSKSARR